MVSRPAGGVKLRTSASEESNLEAAINA